MDSAAGHANDDNLGSPSRSPHGVFLFCPQCDGPMRPEHAHYRCHLCGWRDSCCD